MTELQRFTPFQRVLHATMAVSFIGLVASGMPLKYADAPWAAWLMGLLGGYRAAGVLHRVCAVVTFGYFAVHIGSAFSTIAIKRRFRFNFLGPESMIPWLGDLKDLYGHFRWFFGRGPRPQFGRFTYWEKFDYWAVFWGVGMIGVSGLFLWFPEFFGRFFPGWVFNMATVIHSDEALLAAGFIFTIHFFNTHLRPDKFPMDPVIFTGRTTPGELRRERPREYERLVTENALARHTVGPQAPWLSTVAILFGFTLIFTGFALLVLIVLGQFLY